MAHAKLLGWANDIETPRGYLSPGDVCTVALLVGALVFRLALLTGSTGSDDINYFHFSEEIVSGEKFSELHHHGARLFFLLLIGVPGVILGSIQGGAVVNVLMYSLRDVLVVCYLRPRTNATATASAAGVLSLNSISTVYAGILAPDGLLSLFAFLTAIVAFESTRQAGARRYVYAAAAGVLAGISYSAKDTGILLVPCALLWMVAPGRLPDASTLRGGLTGAILFVGGFALVYGLEMISYLVLSGDPLYRIHAFSHTHNTAMEEVGSLLEFIRRGYWNLANVIASNAGSTPLLAAGAVIWAWAILRRSRYAFFAFAGSFMGLYLILGSSSFSRFIPLPTQDRYFEVIVPLLAVSVAGIVFETVSTRNARRLAIAIPALLGLASVPSIIINARDITFSTLGRNMASGIEAVHRARPEQPIYVSPVVHFMLEPFLSTERYRQLKLIPGTGSLGPGFYIINSFPGAERKFARAQEVQAMADYIVVETERYTLARFLRPSPAQNSAVIKARFEYCPDTPQK